MKGGIANPTIKPQPQHTTHNPNIATMVFTRSIFVGSLVIVSSAVAFQPTLIYQPRRISSHLQSSSEVEEFIATKFPSASNLLAKNNEAMKTISKSELGFTVFAPNEEAFKALGDKKREQLKDVRNDEVTEKVAAYHVIAEPVTEEQLYNSGGVITVGGEVPCERSRSGGLFGVGGKEDGGVELNGAKVLSSKQFNENGKLCIVHEMNGLISPSILWRYADQLRIPGSK